MACEPPQLPAKQHKTIADTVVEQPATITAPDSIHVVKLPGKQELWQCFGPEIWITYELMDVSGRKPVKLDSLASYQGIDLYKQQKITYDFTNDWFVFGAADSGSNDYVEYRTYARVDGKRLVELFTNNPDISFSNFDTDEPNILSMQTKILKINTQEIVLSAHYTKRVYADPRDPQSELRTVLTLKDEATFGFDRKTQTFRFVDSHNPRFAKVWRGETELPE